MLILATLSIRLNNLFIQSNTIESIEIQYSQLQKAIGIYGIIAFITLLILSFIIYYLTHKRTYLFLSNIFYIAIILFVFVTINKSFYTFQNIEYSKSTEYWLTLFMGIFYIIGSILVSAIGYITIRNYTNRFQHPTNRVNKKID